MSCTSIPLADSPCRSVTGWAPSIASVAVRLSDASTYPIDRRRTTGSLPVAALTTAGGEGPAAVCGDGSEVAAVGGGGAEAMAGTAGADATAGATDVAGLAELRRSTRARGGSSCRMEGAATGGVAGTGSGGGWRRPLVGSGRDTSDPTGHINNGRLTAAAARPTMSAHRHNAHSRTSVHPVDRPAAGVSRGSRSRRASRIVLTTALPPEWRARAGDRSGPPPRTARSA